MDILKIVSAGIISGLICVLIKKTNPEIALQLGIATGVILLLFAWDYFDVIIDFLSEISSAAGDFSEAVKLLIKITGIAYISEYAVQLLKDAGQQAIGIKVAFCAKLIIIGVSLPYIYNFIQLIGEFL